MYRFMKQLPIECVKPEGWLKNQLNIQAKGLTRKLYHVWDSTGSYSGWLGGTGEDWERGPYYIDGVLPLAYYTQDEELLAIAMRFIRWTLQSQDEQGNFGPLASKSDWWSRIVMLKVLMQYYEIYQDKQVLDFVVKYFHYMDKNIEANPIVQWGAARVPDLLYCLLRFSNWVKIDCFDHLVEILNHQTLNWCDLYQNFPFTRPTSYYYNWKELAKETDDHIYKLMQYHPTHIVNVTMGLKQPAVLYMLTGNEEYRIILEQGLAQLTKYHGVATGMFNGDEHLSGPNPTQGTELCAVVEYMFSLEIILEALGDSKYGDMLEKIAYNALPSTITEDFMAHQYLQQLNQIKSSHAPRNWFNNKNDANTYGLEPHFGCCTANMHQGWPKFLRGLWYSNDTVLYAPTYAPSSVCCDLAGGPVEILETTEYPFKGNIRFSIKQSAHKFGIGLKIPTWCQQVQISVNGQEIHPEPENGYVVITRTWTTGDTIDLDLPMEVSSSRWYKNSLSVQRGPLIFGLEMEESWTVTKTIGGINDYEITSQTPWNYALTALSDVEIAEYPVSTVPFSKSNPPVALTVQGTQLPNWQEASHMAGEIPNSPVEVKGQNVPLRLIPYGCTKLRIAQFPTNF